MDKEKLQRELKTWGQYNPIIAKKLRTQLKELESVPEPKQPEPKQPEPKPKPEPKKLSKRELWDLKKEEQIQLLKKLGVEKVPELEKDRVKLLLEKQ